MIQNYKDHAANERTYLAWIRTAISLMTFGFIVEKFELFIASMRQTELTSSLSAQFVGLALFFLAILLIISSTVRFFIVRRDIDAQSSNSYKSKKSMLFLSVLMILIAVFLFFYMSMKIVS